MERLWDIEQIKQLKAKYCYYVDEYFEDPANLGRLMHEVFTDDTELDFETVGTAKGHAETEASSLTWSSAPSPSHNTLCTAR